MSERFFQSDVRASGQLFEYNLPLRQVYALSGALYASGPSAASNYFPWFGPDPTELGYNINLYWDNDNGQLQIDQGDGGVETSLLLFGDGAGGNYLQSINHSSLLVTFYSNGAGGRFLFRGNTGSPVVTVSGGILSTATISGLLGTFHTAEIRGMDTDVRYALSGAYITSSGNWEISGTSEALAATLPGLYQASGLYEVSGTSYTKDESDALFVTGTGTSGTLPVFDDAKNLTNSLLRQVFDEPFDPLTFYSGEFGDPIPLVDNAAHISGNLVLDSPTGDEFFNSPKTRVITVGPPVDPETFGPAELIILGGSSVSGFTGPVTIQGGSTVSGTTGGSTVYLLGGSSTLYPEYLPGQIVIPGAIGPGESISQHLAITGPANPQVSGVGGNVVISPGTGGPGGGDGQVCLVDPTALKQLIFGTDLLTDHRTIKFPDQDGTFALSGQSYTKAESTARFEVSGTSAALAATLPGLYEPLDSAYTKAESDAKYQLSGFPAEGSGLYQAGTNYHVGSGFGIVVSDSGIRVDTSTLDTRYQASGNYITSVAPATFEGSGLYAAGSLLHVGVGFGLTVSDSGVRVNTTDLDTRYPNFSGTFSSGQIGRYDGTKFVAATYPPSPVVTTYSTPAGYSHTFSNQMRSARIQMWGGGGGGGRIANGNAAGGGGGGAYFEFTIGTKQVTGALTLVVGSGGAGGAAEPSNGTAGGNTTVSGTGIPFYTIYGGGGGNGTTPFGGGGGGGQNSAGATTAGGGNGGGPFGGTGGGVAATVISIHGGGGGAFVTTPINGGESYFGGGGGGCGTATSTNTAGGPSTWGGGGGGGGSDTGTIGAGGISQFGGNGGAGGTNAGAAVSGVAPAGGGGGNEGAPGAPGGDGRVVITEW